MLEGLQGKTTQLQRVEHGPAPARKGTIGAALVRALGVPLPLESGVVFALSVAFGAAIYFAQTHEPPWIWVATGLVLGAAAWRGLGAVHAVPSLAVFGLAVFGLTLGWAAGKARMSMVEAPVIEAGLGPVLVEGWVAGIDRGASGPRLTLQVHAISGLAPDQTPPRVRMTHRLDLKVAPGRFVRCFGVLRPPPAPSISGDYNFRREAWFRGLGGVGYVMGRCQGGALGAPSGIDGQLGVHLSSLRRQFAEFVNQAAGPEAGGFAAALMAGDRSFMAPEDAEALRGAGLAHILAISGLHLGIVGGLVYLMVRRGLALVEPLALRVAVQKPAAATALVACAAYLILSGASVSTQRAFIMAAIFFGAILFDRAALSLRSFAIAMVCVVLLHPDSVMTPGFQMSFAATGALIATYEAWGARRRAAAERAAPRGSLFVVQSLVVTSVVGALATAPFALFHFGRVAAFGLAANLMAMPIITFLSAPLAAASLVAAPFGLSDEMIGLFGLTLEWVLAIAHFFDRGPPALLSQLPPVSPWSLGGFIASLSCFVMAIGRLRLFLVGFFLALACVAWAQGPRIGLHWSVSGDVYVADEAGMSRVQFIEGDGLGPLRFVNAPIIQDCRAEDCQFDTPLGPVTLHHGDAGALTCRDLASGIHLFTEGRETWCPGSYVWADRTEEGALTLWIAADGGVRAQRTAPCTGRPWARCPRP
ncbi:MAG: ComEC/Rec2 family competence protein [Pseudomonadota bacterium]